MHNTISSSIDALVAAFRAQLDSHLGKRPDSEFEQAAVRAVIGSLMLAYFWTRGLRSGHVFQLPADGLQLAFYSAAICLYFGAGALLVHIYFKPGPAPLRRVMGILLDVAGITFFMLTTDATTVPVYALYLWVIFGNGFRYGQVYLYFALVLSLIGFGAALTILPQWEANQPLGLGLWGGMIAVSAYVGFLAKRLTTALRNAESANMAKRRFVSGVSHELRTPLNTIIGSTDLLRTTQLDAEQSDMVATLQESSRLMLTLIQDVLDFSKIEAGKQTLENLQFDLRELVQCAVGVLRYQAMEKGLDLSVEFGSGVPVEVVSDQRHLRQILINLLANAVKFTETGWVKCRVNRTGYEDDKLLLRFEVADSGIGIPESRQSCIFESFTQADESTTRRYGGTGLGTTIAKQLVEFLGGKIGLESEVGKGSIFWFDLPLEPVETSSASPRRAEAKGSQSGPLLIPRALRPLNVLIAEDNPTNVRVVQQILQRAGHRHALATDGEKALEMMAAGCFDVVLLDMNMPEMSGVEVARAYRFMVGEQERARLILLSADASMETREAGERAGIDVFMPKPIQTGHFLDFLGSLSPRTDTACQTGPDGSRVPTDSVGDIDPAVLADLRALSSDVNFLPTLLSGYVEDNQALVDQLGQALADRRLSSCQQLLHAMKGSAVSIGAKRMRSFCERCEAMKPEELFSSHELVMRECHRVFSSLTREIKGYVIHTEDSGIQ